MNGTMISRISAHLCGMNTGIQGMAELAPGVVGVHDTRGTQGELDAYFDMTRWTVRHPNTWGTNLQTGNPQMNGIGVLPQVRTSSVIVNFRVLLHYAQVQLIPVDDELGWYAEPKQISPSEAGGLAMASSPIESEPPCTNNQGILTRALQFLGFKRSSLFTPTQRTAILFDGKDLDVERNEKCIKQACAKSNSTIRVSYDPLEPFSRGNEALFDLEAAFTGTITIPYYVAKKLDDEARPLIMRQLECSVGDFPNLATRHRNARMRNTRVLKITPDMDMRATLRDYIGTTAEYADAEHLLSVYIYAHGTKDSFEVGFGEFMSYAQLFGMLDNVSGKKLVILCACHSGNLIEFVKGYEQRENYSVITSTSGELATSWNDDEFNPVVANAIAQGMPLSQIELRVIKGANHEQRPQKYLGFDVRP